MDIFRNVLKLSLRMIYQSDSRRHVEDCVQQVFQQSFEHLDNLEALIQVSDVILYS